MDCCFVPAAELRTDKFQQLPLGSMIPSSAQLTGFVITEFRNRNFLFNLFLKKLVKLYMTKLFIFAENIDIKEVNYGKW